jgi:hypothetical protein
MAKRRDGPSPPAVAAAISAVMPDACAMHEALREDLEGRHGKGMAHSAYYRQLEAEAQLSFPAANVDVACDVVGALDELSIWGRSPVGRAAAARGILLTGEAGAGKTHTVCDIAHDRCRRGLYTVALFGEHFTADDDPWDRMCQLLGIGPLTPDELLAVLDAAGEASGGPLLLCIDGLNESRPRPYWRGRLASFAGRVAAHPHVRLCVSCRSTYEPTVIPEGHGLERVEHFGFAGLEGRACREFFAHYRLEPPVAPSFHPEFSNPLFLRLACETLQAAGQRQPGLARPEHRAPGLPEREEQGLRPRARPGRGRARPREGHARVHGGS